MLLSGQGGEEWSKAGCSKCRGKDYKDQDGMRWARNCNNLVPDNGPSVYFEPLPTLRECPWGLVGNVYWLYTLWKDYDDFGVIPFGCKSMNEVPIFVLEAFRIIKAECPEPQIPIM